MPRKSDGNAEFNPMIILHVERPLVDLARLGTVRAIQKCTKKYCLQVGIDQAVSVHSLRVTAATEAYRAGVRLKDIQEWLGHKDPRTTLAYIRGGENLYNSPPAQFATANSN